MLSKVRSTFGEFLRHGLPPMPAVILLALAAVLLYGHTLDVPWYFDDHEVIRKNPRVRALGEALTGLFNPRGVGLFSFALNYHFSGQAVAAYHLTNIAIHLFCSCLVYRLLLRLFVDDRRWPLLGALLFLAHPLQTQAVTYVVQRMTSLSAAFFLLALELFLLCRARVAGCSGGWPLPARCWYALGLLAGALAVLTKENAAVLPLALILFVRCFDGDDRRWRPLLLQVAPFFVVPLIVAAVAFSGLATGQADISGITGVARSEGEPLRYLATQFSVLWIYLRLLILPYGQTLDYGYPLVATFWNVQTLAALAGWLVLGVCAWKWRARLPLAAFGLGWFLLTLAVESSLIPLDPLFEHRLYLPMFGFVVALIGTFRLLLRPEPAIAVLLLAVACYGVLTWQRNDLWRDPWAFSVDNVQKAPANDRAFFNLAARSINSGDYRRGVMMLREALQRFPASSMAYLKLADLAKVNGRLDEAEAILRQALANCPDRAPIYNNLGYLFALRRMPDRAVEYLRRAIDADPDFAESYFNMARLLSVNGAQAEAEGYYRRGFERSRRSPAAYVDFGRLLQQQGRAGEAREAFRRALQLDPEHRDAAAELAAGR